MVSRAVFRGIAVAAAAMEMETVRTESKREKREKKEQRHRLQWSRFECSCVMGGSRQKIVEAERRSTE